MQVWCCWQVKLCDPDLSALEVRFSRRGAIQIDVYLYLYLYCETYDLSIVRARRYTRKRYFGRKDKSKEAKWKISMQNTRLDEEKRQWLYISEFERDGTCRTRLHGEIGA